MRDTITIVIEKTTWKLLKQSQLDHGFKTMNGTILYSLDNEKKLNELIKSVVNK